MRSPPANAGDGTCVQSLVQKFPHASGQLGPRTTTTEPTCPKTHALQQEKPPKSEAHAPQLESSSFSLQLDNAHVQQWRVHDPQQKPSAVKKKKITLLFPLPINWSWLSRQPSQTVSSMLYLSHHAGISISLKAPKDA